PSPGVFLRPFLPLGTRPVPEAGLKVHGAALLLSSDDQTYAVDYAGAYNPNQESNDDDPEQVGLTWLHHDLGHCRVWICGGGGVGGSGGRGMAGSGVDRWGGRCSGKSLCVAGSTL
ncbi:hypothetical protein J4Q44_G00170010, partial [Coregonus suidteri]